MEFTPILIRNLDDMMERNKRLINDMKLNMTITIEIAQALEEQNSQEKLRDRMTEMEEIMKQYASLQEKLKKHNGVLGEIKGLRGSEAAADPKFDLANWSEGRLNQLYPADVAENAYKTHPSYKEYKQKVWAVHHKGQALLPYDEADDDEENIQVVSQQSDQTTCPILGTEMEDPMKNTLCGHSYSRAGIEGLIKQKTKGARNASVQCPIPGCGATVAMNTLEDDQELERKLARARRQNKNKHVDEDEDEIISL